MIMTTLSVFAYRHLRTIKVTAMRVTKDTMPCIYLTGKLQTAMLLRYTLLTDHIDADSQGEKAQLEGQIDRVYGEEDDVLSEYEKLINDTKDRELFEALKSARTPYVGSLGGYCV